MRHFRPTPVSVLAALWLVAGAASASPASSVMGTDDGVTWGPWYELRPLDHPTGSASVAEPHEPERSLRALRLDADGPNLGKEFRGKGRTTVVWSESEYRASEEDPLGDQVAMDFTRGLQPAQSDKAVAFLYRAIDSDAARDVWALVGSDDGMRMWLNGELVVDMPIARAVREAENKLALRLGKGRNHLLVKVGNGGSAWGFQLIHDQKKIEELRARSELDINKSIDRGVEYLLSTQYPDGSWQHRTNAYRNGQTALAVYTLLKSGVPPHGDSVQRGIRYLRSRMPSQTYSAACQLMAYAAMKDPALRPDMEAITELLIDWQNMGGYAYPRGGIDLSNTQYGALGLRAAHHAGVRIRSRVWSDLAEHVLAYQHDDGGFGYHRRSAPTGSMTAAGLTVLGACLEVMSEQNEVGGKLKRIEKAMQNGVAWLVRHWTVRGNPRGGGTWTLYYLYGLERVGAFLRVSRFGPHDWYWDGAMRLLDTQKGDGQWNVVGGSEEPDTCFALLFLERATATVSGAGERKRTRGYGSDDPTAAVSLRASGDTPLTVWVSSFGEATVRDYTWPLDQGDGLRVKRVEYAIDGGIVETVQGDAMKPAGLARFPAQLRFPRVGDYVVTARVVLTTAPPETKDVVIESAPLEVQIRDMVNEETISYASDSTRNLLTEARFDASATSQFGGHAPRHATDDRLSTCWLSGDQEGVHVWTLELKRAIRADTLLLTQAWPNPREPDHCARFTRLEVIVNKRRKNPIVIDTSADLSTKTEIPFGKVEAVRHLEIKILAHVPGATRAHAVGFSEVELQLRGANKRTR